MIIKTRIFKLHNSHSGDLSELAKVMGVSVNKIYDVREGKGNIDQEFVVGVMKAFPDYNLADLFYLTSERPMA